MFYSHRFEGNVATGTAGGAVRLVSSAPGSAGSTKTFTNCTFVSNSVLNAQSAINGGGGDVSVYRLTDQGLTMRACTFVGSSSSASGGVLSIDSRMNDVLVSHERLALLLLHWFFATHAVTAHTSTLAYVHVHTPSPINMPYTHIHTRVHTRTI